MRAVTVETDRPRRKGQPLPVKKRPLRQDILRLYATALFGVLLIFGIFFFFSKAKEIIRFSYDEAVQTAQLGAQVLERDGGRALGLAEEVSRIAEDDLRCTEDYTADEQVVVLSLYAALQDSEETEAIRGELSEIAQRSARVRRLSYVLCDGESGIARVIADPERPCGYAYQTEGFGKEQITHEAYAPVRDGQGQVRAYVAASFDSNGIFSREYRGMIPAFVIAFGYAVIYGILIFRRISEAGRPGGESGADEKQRAGEDNKERCEAAEVGSGTEGGETEGEGG